MPRVHVALTNVFLTNSSGISQNVIYIGIYVQIPKTCCQMYFFKRLKALQYYACMHLLLSKFIRQVVNQKIQVKYLIFYPIHWFVLWINQGILYRY